VPPLLPGAPRVGFTRGDLDFPAANSPSFLIAEISLDKSVISAIIIDR